MTFKTKIQFAEYRKLMFVLTYRKWAIWVMTLSGLVMLIATLMQSLHVIEPVTDTWNGLIFGIVFTLLVPFSIFRASKKNFNSNARIQEQIEYTFTNDNMLLVKGESFKSEMELDKIYKTKELKNWFLVYQSKQIANLIPKSDLTNEQITELRYILDRVMR